jgi:hypothetical protein
MHLLPCPEPFPVSWPLPLKKWTVLGAAQAGNGMYSVSKRLAHHISPIARIFILEGLVPIACSFVVWWLLPDSPERARFLTKEEKEFIINRIAVDTGSGRGHVTNADKINMSHIKRGLSEWRIYLMILVYWANSVGVYGYVHSHESLSSFKPQGMC